MPIITSITAQVKNRERCNVFIDGEFDFSASLETVMLHSLKVGKEISVEELNQIKKESDNAKALEIAIAYISRTLKTKKQVKDYLIRKGYSEDVAYYCIDKLKEYKLIDDTHFAKRYVECNSKTQGKRLYEYKLMMKGVKKDDINKGVAELEIDGRANAKEVAIKYLRNKDKTRENILKAYRYLIGRGFSYEEAEFAISTFKEEE